MKRLLGSTLLLIELSSLLFALFLPLESPWWFIYSFFVAIAHMSYGSEIQGYIFKLMES